MTSLRILGTLCSVGLLLSVVAVAQNDLEDFPLGTTKMSYEIKTDELDTPQILELTVEGYEDGQYRLSLFTEATGMPDQLSAFGFLLGSAAVRAGELDVSYNPLHALIEGRENLEPGQEYILAGDRSFTDLQAVEIASVHCLQGVLVDPSEPDSRMTVAFALTFPVFAPPLIRIDERQDDGTWVTTFSMALTEYAFLTTPEG